MSFNTTFNINVSDIGSMVDKTQYSLIDWKTCANECMMQTKYALGSQAHIAFVIVICCALAVLIFVSLRKNYPMSFYEYIDFVVWSNFIIAILMFIYLAFFI
jgi:hypothetical protein